jgi:uncharacterized membrane protein YhhN
MQAIYSALFLVFSMLYLIFLPFGTLTISWLIKILPLIVLVFAVARTPVFSGKTLLLLALVFSAGGDVLLEQGHFILGVGAFLIAQLHYGIFYARNWSSVKTRWPISVFILIFMLIMVFLLAPHLGELKLPVFAYLTVIGLMGLLAMQSNMPLRWSVFGVLVFILSDSFIAIDRFLHPLPLGGYLIMTTYYGAQWMIIQGALNKFRASRSSLV